MSPVAQITVTQSISDTVLVGGQSLSDIARHITPAMVSELPSFIYGAILASSGFLLREMIGSLKRAHRRRTQASKRQIVTKSEVLIASKYMSFLSLLFLVMGIVRYLQIAQGPIAPLRPESTPTAELEPTQGVEPVQSTARGAAVVVVNESPIPICSLQESTPVFDSFISEHLTGRLESGESKDVRLLRRGSNLLVRACDGALVHRLLRVEFDARVLISVKQAGAIRLENGQIEPICSLYIGSATDPEFGSAKKGDTVARFNTIPVGDAQYVFVDYDLPHSIQYTLCDSNAVVRSPIPAIYRADPVLELTLNEEP